MTDSDQIDRLKPLWAQISDALRPHVSPDTFQRWFAAVVLIEAQDSHITLRVPNNIYQLWIETNYLQLLRSALLSTLGANPEIRFVCEEEKTKKSTAAPPRETTPRSAAPAPSVESPSTSALSNGINPRNTFDSFVVGSNNQFAHAAALAVAQAPAKTYNPLFIYGGTGLGKTHLMHAVGQTVLGRKKSGKVVYLPSERFINEFIDAIQNGTLVKFRRRYRQADVLLIDDIQFLAGKERCQEEFFHTFNALFDGHKQIVLSSDRPANEIQHLEARLVSRFEWGMTAELQPPDGETRLAILRKKAESLNISIEPEVLQFIADRIRSNVRRLEGALMRVASFASLSGKPIKQDTVEGLLRDILQEEAKQSVTIDQIQRRVADHFDIRLADMTSKRRPNNIAFPRQIAMYLSRELTSASLNEIGDAFGGRDHGTVLHAHRTIREKISREEKIRQVVSFLGTQLNR
jgi:chromosomal replication initiator protein